MTTSSDFEKVVAQTLTCPTLTKEEMRFLHTLHLQMLAGQIPPSDLDRERVRQAVTGHRIRVSPDLNRALNRHATAR
jgi:hypothetical protein